MKSMLHRRGKKVHVSHIDIEQSSEGPSHDPYSVIKYWVSFSNGRKVCLRAGSLSGVSLSYDLGRGRKRMAMAKARTPDDEEAELRARFERIVGMSIDRFEKVFYEHFYFEDPMGHPSQYI